MGSDWENPYPGNYEPVKHEGCDMSHRHGYEFNAYLYENKIKATMNCYILDEAEINLITDAHVVKWILLKKAPHPSATG
ncbi:MAG TPA: hypothetical protein O0X23_02905 [Methanocorpusculum sp.]|nr:hypothetical protein [Methanocorpusculum sp.]